MAPSKKIKRILTKILKDPANKHEFLADEERIHANFIRAIGKLHTFFKK